MPQKQFSMLQMRLSGDYLSHERIPIINENLYTISVFVKIGELQAKTLLVLAHIVKELGERDITTFGLIRTSQEFLKIKIFYCKFIVFQSCKIYIV